MEKKTSKKVYFYKFNPYIYILTVVISLVVLPFSVFNLIKVIGVADLVSYHPVLDITSVIFCWGVFIFLMLNIFLTNFTIENGTFVKRRFVKKIIPVEKMLTIRVDKDADMNVLYYADENSINDGISFVILSVAKSKADKLIEDIRELNPHVSVEIIEKRNDL